jgi:opacity protein-like surface antigen
MRYFSLVVASVLFASSVAAAQDVSRPVADGGIKVAGWQGKIDPGEARAGAKLENAKLEKVGNDLHVTTGPAVGYWNPSNVATGNYTVKATFTEEKYMGLNSHPHPYGLFIAGNDMGTDKQSYLYCTAYGDGRFIVRGFSGDSTFRLNGRGEPNAAINKANGVGAPVTQEIALSVKGDKIECAINGQVVGSYDKSLAVGANKLTSTNGVYGIRFGHNTDAVVKGLALTRN